MYCIIVTIIALAYVFWDVNYFLRIAFTIGIGRLFQKKCGVSDTTTIYGESAVLLYLIIVILLGLPSFYYNSLMS